VRSDTTGSDAAGSVTPDPAGSSAGSGSERFQTGGVLTIAGAHALHDTYSAFLPPLLPLFIEKLLLSKTEAGLLTVFLQVPSLIQPAVGHLADRMNLRWIAVLCPAVTAVFMSLLGVAPGYAALALLLTVVGVSSAAFHAVAPVMAGQISGRSLGRGMSFWMVGGELGRTVGPLVVVTALLHMTLESLPWLMIGGLLISAALYIRLPDVPPRPRAAETGLAWRPALARMRPLLGPLAAVIFVRALVIVSLTTFLPTFLTEEGASLWLAGAALTLLQAAGVGGALAGGSLSDRVGRRRVLALAMASAGVLLLLFLLAEGWVRFALLVGLGLTSLSTTPVVMALVQESYPENRALANGVYMALSFMIRSAAVVIVGVLGDTLGLRPAFLISAVVLLLGVPAVFRLPARRGVPGAAGLR
jgi:FSR family fosmidomycin resistance protein-like MFS transporter